MLSLAIVIIAVVILFTFVVTFSLNFFLCTFKSYVVLDLLKSFTCRCCCYCIVVLRRKEKLFLWDLQERRKQRWNRKNCYSICTYIHTHISSKVLNSRGRVRKSQGITKRNKMFRTRAHILLVAIVVFIFDAEDFMFSF